MKRAARLLPFAWETPDRNMAIDVALLHGAPVPTLRLYGWRPAGISLGWFQRDTRELSPLLASGLPVVRRMTGGGAIVHCHEVTYSLVLPLDHVLVRGVETRASYHVLHAPIRRALQRLGVPVEERGGEIRHDGRSPTLCFSRATDLDLVAGGRKLVGSAQRRSRSRVLQHGSILLAAHPLQPGPATLADYLDPVPDPPTLAGLLARSFEALLGPLTPGTLTMGERVQAAKAAPTCAFA